MFRKFLSWFKRKPKKETPFSIGRRGFLGALVALPLVKPLQPPLQPLVEKYNPILISLVRRAMPNLIAYDICGVQPMTGPTGMVFAMRSRYLPKSEAVPYKGQVSKDAGVYYAPYMPNGEEMIPERPEPTWCPELWKSRFTG